MPFRTAAVVGSAVLAVLLWAGAPTLAQRGGMFQGSPDDPAIKYASGPLDNVVDRLNTRLEAGEITLAYQGKSGYLAALLEALHVRTDAQMLVYSPTSLQASRIREHNPRALFFNDQVAVGWVRGGDVLEVATQDTRQGVVFYTFPLKPTEPQRFKRMTTCLGCHMTGDTLGVPGLLMFSTTADSDRKYGSSTFTDHRLPVNSRFGGWFVTGDPGAVAHKGNAVTLLADSAGTPIETTDGLYDADGYVTNSSDIAALMVFSHQAHMTNLLTRAGWEARALDPVLHPDAAQDKASVTLVLRGVAAEVVDYLLFVDEAPLPGPVHGHTAFAEHFADAGPRDKTGRSLRELDLQRRLMKYPCSYLVHSPMFDALPATIKGMIYERLWQVLSGAERGPRYKAALSLDDRKAVVQILRDTRPDLPAYFKPVTK